jgi:hypothetical protein
MNSGVLVDQSRLYATVAYKCLDPGLGARLPTTALVQVNVTRAREGVDVTLVRPAA